MLAVEEQNVAAINDGEGEIDRNPEADMEIDADNVDEEGDELPTNGNVVVGGMANQVEGAEDLIEEEEEGPLEVRLDDDSEDSNDDLMIIEDWLV